MTEYGTGSFVTLLTILLIKDTNMIVRACFSSGLEIGLSCKIVVVMKCLEIWNKFLKVQI